LGWRAGVPVVHIEAGLRSPRLFDPFPEEITRRLVSRLANYHMAPDSKATDNLQRAGVNGSIVNTRGNTLMDAVQLSAHVGEDDSSQQDESFALVNIHRFENLNSASRWEKIMDTIDRAAGKIKLVFVTHPQTRHKLAVDTHSMKRLIRPQIEIRERMPFSQFIGLLKHADFLISDGGSNQEECSYLGKPCLLMRESTERQEGLDTCCVLSGFKQEAIDGFLRDPSQFAAPGVDQGESPSRIILDTLI
jgi:UDP-N-acetylglucosamine 2-epimerase (non-hydrolysing)